MFCHLSPCIIFNINGRHQPHRCLRSLPISYPPLRFFSVWVCLEKNLSVPKSGLLKFILTQLPPNQIELLMWALFFFYLCLPFFENLFTGWLNLPRALCFSQWGLVAGLWIVVTAIAFDGWKVHNRIGHSHSVAFFLSEHFGLTVDTESKSLSSSDVGQSVCS